jgi:hypothetical protein
VEEIMVGAYIFLAIYFIGVLIVGIDTYLLLDRQQSNLKKKLAERFEITGFSNPQSMANITANIAKAVTIFFFAAIWPITVLKNLSEIRR